MAHGLPDWNRTNAPTTIFRVDDLGELAARQKSIVTFDRRGDIVWLDDFEEALLKWTPTTTGTGAAVALDTTQARNGNQSVKLTGGSDGARLARIRHRSAALPSSAFGFEFSFSIGLNFESLRSSIIIRDGVNETIGRVRLNLLAQTLEHLNSSGGFTEFATDVALAADDALFHTCKLVVDFSAGQYMRFLLDSVEYDLSSTDADSNASANPSEVQVEVELISDSGQNDTAFVDDAIITQNEP